MEVGNKKGGGEVGNVIKGFGRGGEWVGEGVVVRREEGGILWCKGVGEEIVGLGWGEDKGEKMVKVVG